MLVCVVAVVLVQTNFGFSPGISYRNDKLLPVVQATGGQVFDLRNIGVAPPPDQESSMTRKSKPPETLTASSDPHVSSKLHPPLSSHGAGDPLNGVEATLPKHRAPNAESRIKQDQLILSMKNPPSRFGSTEHPEAEFEQCDVSEFPKQPVSSKGNLSLMQVVAQSDLSPVPVGIAQPLSSSEQPATEITANAAATTPEIKTALSIVTRSTSNIGVRIQADSYLAKPEELDPNVETDSHPIPSQVLGTENPSPTTGATFPPLNNSGKKLKGSRKSGYKLQKSSQATADANPSSAAVVVPHAPAPVVMIHRSNRDYLERKESESSLKSTDSESTSSSVDKYDEKEDPEPVVSPVITKESAAEKKVVPLAVETVLKLKPLQFSLAKEPNTGQTVHISEASPNSSEVAGNEEDGKRDTGGNLRSSKSKRKLRQQRKEEKSKKKEKEKSSRGARERVDKNHSLMDDSSCSTEQLDEEIVEEVPVSTKLTKPPKLSQNQKSRQKGAPKYVVEPIDPRSYELESNIVPASPTNYADNSGEGNTPPPLPPPSKPSVPSTAIKSSRGVSGKPQYEDIISDPFSRNPDRSTYARKKANPKKSTDKSVRLTPEENPALLANKHARGESGERREALDGSDESIGDDGDSNTTSPEAGDEIVSSTELDPKLKGQFSALNPTSPHDLAASLLSRIPMKRSSKRSVVTGRAKSLEVLEYEDDDMEMMKQDSLEASDEVQKLTRPKTLSPIKDSVMSSPSPPLSGEYKPPSSLSLDAEPFYPSSNFKSKKHSKSDHKNSLQRQDGKKGNTRNGDRKLSVDPKDAELRMGHGAKSAMQHERTPTMEGTMPDMGPMDKTDRAEYYQLHHRDKAVTPSSFPYGDPQAAYRYDMLLDAREHLGEFRRPSGRDPYYSSGAGGVDEATLRAYGLTERGQHDMGGLDSAYFMQKTGRPPPHLQSSQRMNATVYQQQQQQQKFQHMSGHPQAPPGFGHEGPASRVHQLDDFKRQQFLGRRKLIRDLYRQERAALEAVYAREQARKSAEALSSLHNPTRSGGVFSQEPNKHALTGAHGNLWEEYLDPPPSSHQPHLRGFDDASPASTDAESRLLSSPYLLSNQASSQVPPRGRSLSEASDIGGEILSNYQPPGLQSPTSVGPPGYQRAPGAEYSRVEQQQEDHDSVLVGKESSPMLEHQLAWPPEAEVRVA